MAGSFLTIARYILPRMAREDALQFKKVGRRTMQSFEADIRGRVIALVKSILEENAMSAEFAPDAKLVDLGLTSMDMVNLMLAVEAEFDLAIPQVEITPENFLSVETLQRMVAAQLQPSAA